MTKTLFFTPHSAIWLHAFPEALVADALREGGRNVKVITCDRLYSDYCVAMSAAGVLSTSSEAAKAAICRDCRNRAAIVRNSFGFEGGDLNTYIDASDREETERILDTVTRETVADFKLGGIEIGRKSLYETLLQLKKQSLDFSDADWARCRIALKNGLLTYFGAKRLLAEEKPDSIFVYNSLYSVTAVFCEIAKSMGIHAYFLHGGLNVVYSYEELYAAKLDPWGYWLSMKAKWPFFSGIPCESRDLARITDHFLGLLKARTVFVYSSAKSERSENIRDIFGIRRDQKMLVATLSSLDEYFAARVSGVTPPHPQSVFSTQYEWIQHLLAEARKRPDWFLLIRAHPREFPNRRDGVFSEQGKRWKEVLVDLPANVRVNWPEDGISVYDLAEEADVFLNAWSSVGKEMSLLGIPVVVYTRDLLVYPPGLNHVADSVADYVPKIEEALAKGWSFETVRAAYRWHVLELVRSVTNISDGYPHRPQWRRGKIETFIRKIFFRVDPYFQERADCRRRSGKLRNGDAFRKLVDRGAESVLDFAEIRHPETQESIENETRFIQMELERILEALRGKKADRKNSLIANLRSATARREMPSKSAGTF